MSLVTWEYEKSVEVIKNNTSPIMSAKYAGICQRICMQFSVDSVSHGCWNEMNININSFVFLRFVQSKCVQMTCRNKSVIFSMHPFISCYYTIRSTQSRPQMKLKILWMKLKILSMQWDLPRVKGHATRVQIIFFGNPRLWP